jgi:hypothetical protein
MAIGGIKEICRLDIDGEKFFECFDFSTVEGMKARLIKAGIDGERIKLRRRMPNV